MLTSLTEEQQRLMLTVKDEWMSKIFDPEKRLRLNKKEAKKHILWMYKMSELKAPKHVIFVDSPFGMQTAVWMLKCIKGANVGANVRANVGGSAAASVWDRVWDSVRASVGANVGDSVRASVWASVGDSVRDSVRGSVWANVGASVGDSVWDSVGDSVRDSVWASVGDYTPSTYYGNISDYGWCAFFDFFKRIGILKNDNFDRFLNLLDSGIYDTILMENVAIACPMPSQIHRTDVRGQMRLHAENGFAIEWPDGYGQNYLYGVFFPDNIWKIVQKRNPKDILSLTNIEQRMAALKLIGPEAILENTKAKMLDTSDRGNELYELKDVFPVTAYFLKYTDPSTGRVYVSGVPPEEGRTNDADHCMAWKFHLSKEEYRSISLQA